MQDPEAYLRALTAPLAWAREGSPLPVVRFSLEAVANALVLLGLLPAVRAEEILAAQRPVLEAAGFRVGLAIGELSVSPGTRGFQEARAAGADSLRRIPLAVAAGPARCRLRGHDLAITWATLTPEGIWLRYHGDARESDRSAARASGEEITEEITQLSITDDTGGSHGAGRRAGFTCGCSSRTPRPRRSTRAKVAGAWSASWPGPFPAADMPSRSGTHGRICPGWLSANDCAARNWPILITARSGDPRGSPADTRG